MASIRLSKRQAGDADRVGGIELMILWPEELGSEDLQDLRVDHEREATPAERAVAEKLVGASCREHGLVPVHTRVVRIFREPRLQIAGGEVRLHLAVTIIGRRWVGASTSSRGIVRFSGAAQ